LSTPNLCRMRNPLEIRHPDIFSLMQR